MSSLRSGVNRAQRETESFQGNAKKDFNSRTRNKGNKHQRRIIPFWERNLENGGRVEKLLVEVELETLPKFSKFPTRISKSNH
jgi:hypothetical protein